MSNAIEATDATFEEITNSEETTVVDFWAPWCGPCKQISPLLDELSSQFDSVRVAKVNIDENRTSASSHKIQSIPTLIAFRNGVEISRNVGFSSRGKLEAFFAGLSE